MPIDHLTLNQPGPFSSHFQSIEVEAGTVADARLAAIDICYRQCDAGEPELVNLGRIEIIDQSGS